MLKLRNFARRCAAAIRGAGRRCGSLARQLWRVPWAAWARRRARRQFQREEQRRREEEQRHERIISDLVELQGRKLDELARVLLAAAWLAADAGLNVPDPGRKDLDVVLLSLAREIRELGAFADFPERKNFSRARLASAWATATVKLRAWPGAARNETAAAQTAKRD